jgi:hypothetical protein
MENMEYFCVSHNYTQRDPVAAAFAASTAAAAAAAALPLYTCIYIAFSELRRIILK